MKRHLLLLPALALVLVSGLASAQQEVWACTFKGTWTEGAAPRGEFTWKVTWTGFGETWLISGKTDNSETRGTCDGKSCKIEEKILSGEEKGTSYYWAGTYYDEEGRTDESVVERFTGTWGPSPSDRESGGTWKAKATCKLKK